MATLNQNTPIFLLLNFRNFNPDFYQINYFNYSFLVPTAVCFLVCLITITKIVFFLLFFKILVYFISLFLDACLFDSSFFYFKLFFLSISTFYCLNMFSYKLSIASFILSAILLTKDCCKCKKTIGTLETKLLEAFMLFILYSDFNRLSH